MGAVNSNLIIHMQHGHDTDQYFQSGKSMVFFLRQNIFIPPIALSVASMSNIGIPGKAST